MVFERVFVGESSFTNPLVFFLAFRQHSTSLSFGPDLHNNLARHRVEDSNQQQPSVVECIHRPVNRSFRQSPVPQPLNRYVEPKQTNKHVCGPVCSSIVPEISPSSTSLPLFFLSMSVRLIVRPVLLSPVQHVNNCPSSVCFGQSQFSQTLVASSLASFDGLDCVTARLISLFSLFPPTLSRRSVRQRVLSP